MSAWECLACGNRTTEPNPWDYGKQQCPTCGSRKMRPYRRRNWWVETMRDMFRRR